MQKVVGFILLSLLAPSFVAADAAAELSSPSESSSSLRGRDLQEDRGDGRRLVSCGGHSVGQCGDCPWNNGRWMGKAWCNGECTFLNGECVEREDTAWCGGHAAKDCGHCPWNGEHWMASAWCNGDCFWMDNKCIHRDDTDEYDWCGGHAAKDCGHCPWNGDHWMASSWCNGECKWRDDECVHEDAEEPEPRVPMDTNCGDHKAIDCGHCPFNIEGFWVGAPRCEGECVWQNEECIHEDDAEPEVTLDAWCGGHAAIDCAHCPWNGDHWMASSWCNGECTWHAGDEECIHKDDSDPDDPEEDGAWCGGHAAKDCGHCPWNGETWMASSWCNGECVWKNSECVHKDDVDPGEPDEPLDAWCGGHAAIDCSDCPWNGDRWMASAWCNGECKWNWNTEECVHKDHEELDDAIILETLAADIDEEPMKAWCGGHAAIDCGHCPWNGETWMAASWCNGECVWRDDQCIYKEDAEPDDAWCGGHAAKDCANCPWNMDVWMASAWCNGVCVWRDDECIHKDDAPDDDAWCGGHAAKDCGHCPWNGNTWMAAGWCNGDCVWQNNDCINKDDAEPDGAWCGGHGAKDCGHCPWNGETWMASAWCNGDCVWQNEKCIGRDDAELVVETFAIEEAQIDLPRTNGFHEHLGQCGGAVCSLWGDPHIVSCDGLAWDCQAHGIFTLMKNHLYDIQGQFIPVGAVEQELVWNWGLRDGATVTNDLMIDYLPGEKDVPVMQFSFPDLSKHEGDDIMTEEGCEKSQYYDPLDMPNGGGRTVEMSLLDCRNRCEKTSGCAKFSYWADGGCHLQDEASTLVNTPAGWSRNVAGTLDGICGKEMPELDASGLEIEDDFKKSKTIGNERGHHGPGCPVLFYLDGKLQDISNLADNAFLYGDETSEHSAQLVGSNEIHVKHITETGAESELLLRVAGNGPGELWSCHWNFWVCLPAEEQVLFEEGSVGLFGTPDGNAQNDWMDPTGATIPIPHGGHKGREAFDYCHDNWCVAQEDSLMAYPTGNTYDNHKCTDEEYVDFNVDQENCVLSSSKISESCKDMPPLMLHSCQLDCCLGGCAEFEEVADTVIELQPYAADPNPDIIIYDPPVLPDLCDERSQFKASCNETACPNSPGGIVKVLDSSDELPADKDIIYGISLGDYNRDDDIGRTVKFHVSSPFKDEVDVFLRYEKKVGLFANNPTCDRFESNYCGPNEIEVGCIEFPNVPPFAIVDLYFVSNEDSFILGNAAPDTEVEKCCYPPSEKYADQGYKIVKYSFEIQCTCPERETDTSL